MEGAPSTSHPGNELLRVAEAVHAGEVSAAFRSGPTVMAKVGDKLLDIAEASQVPIQSGCRTGMCGSDPVRVVEGEDNLSAMLVLADGTPRRVRVLEPGDPFDEVGFFDGLPPVRGRRCV